MAVSPHVRWLIRKDLKAVLVIEQACFEYPWSEEDFKSALRQRDHDCIGMVAELDDKLVGYMIYELFDDRIELTNLAVAPKHQAHGIGAILIGKLKDKLAPPQAPNRLQIVTEVRDTNLNAQLFFRAMGFRATSVVATPYTDCDDDSYRFEFPIDSEIH